MTPILEHSVDQHQACYLPVKLPLWLGFIV
jgi:hypothetical protein